MIPTRPRYSDEGVGRWHPARREQLRRWAELPLERIVAALEEMEELANRLDSTRGAPPRAGRVDP